MDFLSIPNYYKKKGRPHVHRYENKPRRSRVLHREFAQEVQEDELPGHPRPIQRDEKFRKNMIDNGRTEENCRQMDDFADEDHTHQWTPEEIDDYRSNWWIRSKKIGSDTMPVGTDVTSNKHCLLCDSYKRQRRCSSSQPKMDAKLFFVLVELARIMVALFLRESPRRRTQHRLIRETWQKKWLGHLIRGLILRIQLLYYRWIVYSWRRSTVTDGDCSITTRRIGTTRTTTSVSESTTMWTPMTTLTHRTSTIVWRITTCTEPARKISESLIITLTFMAQAESCTFHTISMPSMRVVVSLWLDLLHSLLPSLLPVCLPLLFFHLSDEQQPELKKKIMENLCDSTDNGSEGTYDVLHLSTVMGKSNWENPVEVRWWEGFQFGMSLCASRKRIILICVCGSH